MPHQGTVTVFYNTQNGSPYPAQAGSAYADTDYTATGDQELTFTSGYDYSPQTITVSTSSTSNGGTFSVVIPCYIDPFAATPGIPQSAAAAIKSNNATLNVATMDCVNGVNTPGSWLSGLDSKDKPIKQSQGAWVPLNTENNGYQFTPNTNSEIEDKTDGASVANFHDNALLPIQIELANNVTKYELKFAAHCPSIRGYSWH